MTRRHVALSLTLAALLLAVALSASTQSAREEASLTDLVRLLQSEDATEEELEAALSAAERLLGDPPACDPDNPMFDDVPADNIFCPFIEELARRGITEGCGGNNFCPGDPLTRAQMATFIVKTLGEPAWHEVGAPGEPSFTSNLVCTWSNFDAGHSSAAFVLDGNGFVHLKGVVQVDDVSVGGACEDDFDLGSSSHLRTVFVLPEGFRPARTGALTTLANSALGRVTIHAGTSGEPAGRVTVDPPTTFANADEWVSLDGISFRAATPEESP